MILTNSYIFLKKPHKKEHPKKDSGSERTITFEIGNNVYSYISKSFPNLSKGKENSGYFKTRYAGFIQIETDLFDVEFIINEVVDTTYLDISVSGKSKGKVIKCLEEIQETILASGVQEDYIDIVSYDAISEYYCNKILPKLNALERNLRKLLFNIYIVNFGRNYYQATVSKDLQDKIKGVIRVKGNEEKKEIERLRQFFYSFEFNDIQKLLFIPTWTSIDEERKNKFLTEHTDLSQLSDDELRNAFSQLVPRSDWDRFFRSKIDIPDIEEIIDQIRQYRNSIAHFKFFYKDEFTESNRLITQLNKAVLRAIKLTEEKDFVEKNSEYLCSAMADIFKTFEEYKKVIAKAMNETIIPTIKVIKEAFSPILQQFRETYIASNHISSKSTQIEQQNSCPITLSETEKN